MCDKSLFLISLKFAIELNWGFLGKWKISYNQKQPTQLKHDPELNTISILAIFVHASLRQRNLKNKVVNTIETIGIKQSPMGKFLEAMNLMPDTFQ